MPSAGFGGGIHVYATNDPAVTVSVVWRKLDATVRLSNDGSFSDDSGAMTFDVAPKLDWTLATEGSERLPRTVYARLSGRPGAEDRLGDPSGPRGLNGVGRGDRGGLLRGGGGCTAPG